MHFHIMSSQSSPHHPITSHLILAVVQQPIHLMANPYVFIFDPDSSCVQLNGTFPDPADKAGYIVCTNGKAVRKACPQATIWNDVKKICEKPGEPIDPS